MYPCGVVSGAPTAPMTSGAQPCIPAAPFGAEEASTTRRSRSGRTSAISCATKLPIGWQTRQAQYDAVCAWGIPNHSLLQRVAAIDLPVFVANGDSDPMILPRYSHLLAGLLPDPRLTIYPDSAHGFLFQHHSRFAADVHAFLTEAIG
jgi:pimeloyl-ACP methyl ester carboxylesterase